MRKKFHNRRKIFRVWFQHEAFFFYLKLKKYFPPSKHPHIRHWDPIHTIFYTIFSLLFLFFWLLLIVEWNTALLYEIHMKTCNSIFNAFYYWFFAPARAKRHFTFSLCVLIKCQFSNNSSVMMGTSENRKSLFLREKIGNAINSKFIFELSPK